MPPLDPPPAPLAPGGNASPTAPIAPLPAGQSASPTAPPAPLAAGQAASPSAPPAPLPSGGNVSANDDLRITGTLTMRQVDGVDVSVPTPLTLKYAGQHNGKPSWTPDGQPVTTWVGNDVTQIGYTVHWRAAVVFPPSAASWRFTSTPTTSADGFRSSEDVATPDLVTSWTVVPNATGTPSFTLIRGGTASPPQPFPAGQSSTPTAPPAPLGGGQSVSPSAPPAPLAAGAGLTPSAPPAPLAPGRTATPPSPPQPV